MAVISLTIPNDKIDRITTAFCAEYGYQETITNPDGTTSPNPETKAAFTKRMVIQHVRQVTSNFEANIAAGTARKTVETDVSGINIT